MRRDDAFNIFNSIKDDVNKVIKSMPENKLTKEECNRIINITINRKKYNKLPSKYTDNLNIYIEAKIENIIKKSED
ncbi:MAG: hypothetical protein M0R80_04115 [Proteobacteria bacterium]|jgi:deoxyhypusine synthase|nr:hypothetical protein [Pseudomonadota bacterium]